MRFLENTIKYDFLLQSLDSARYILNSNNPFSCLQVQRITFYSASENSNSSSSENFKSRNISKVCANTRFVCMDSHVFTYSRCQETINFDMQIYIATNPCEAGRLPSRIVKAHSDFSLHVSAGNVSQHWITFVCTFELIC